MYWRDLASSMSALSLGRTKTASVTGSYRSTIEGHDPEPRRFPTKHCEIFLEHELTYLNLADLPCCPIPLADEPARRSCKQKGTRYCNYQSRTTHSRTRRQSIMKPGDVAFNVGDGYFIQVGHGQHQSRTASIQNSDRF
jgi:hypothetical protein